MERIAKRIAASGLCSRREAEKLIDEGRVSVNRIKITTPAFNVANDDRIEVDGRPINTKPETRLYMFYKPSGYLTTNYDPQGRPIIFDLIPEKYGRLITIGRLDMTTEGLILLTNNGDLARHMELPSTGLVRQYLVRVYGAINERHLKELANGVTIDGISYKEIRSEIVKTNRYNSWLKLFLIEGKNREVRKVLQFLDLTVNRLIRLSYGRYNLGSLEKGELQPVRYEN